MRIRQLLLALLLFSPLAVLGEDCPEDLFAAVDRLSLSGHPITAGSLSEPTGICSGLSIEALNIPADSERVIIGAGAYKLMRNLARREHAVFSIDVSPGQLLSIQALVLAPSATGGQSYSNISLQLETPQAKLRKTTLNSRMPMAELRSVSMNEGVARFQIGSDLGITPDRVLLYIQLSATADGTLAGDSTAQKAAKWQEGFEGYIGLEDERDVIMLPAQYSGKTVTVNTDDDSFRFTLGSYDDNRKLVDSAKGSGTATLALPEAERILVAIKDASSADSDRPRYRDRRRHTRYRVSVSASTGTAQTPLQSEKVTVQSGPERTSPFASDREARAAFAAEYMPEAKSRWQPVEFERETLQSLVSTLDALFFSDPDSSNVIEITDYDLSRLTADWELLTAQQRQRLKPLTLPPNDPDSYFHPSKLDWQSHLSALPTKVVQLSKWQQLLGFLLGSSSAHAVSITEIQFDPEDIAPGDYVTWHSAVYDDLMVHIPQNVLAALPGNFSEELENSLNSHLMDIGAQVLTAAEEALPRQLSFFGIDMGQLETPLEFWVVGDMYSGHTSSANGLHYNCQQLYISAWIEAPDGTTAHELFHCFQNSLGMMGLTRIFDEKWMIEGGAEVGEHIGLPQRNTEHNSYPPYASNPDISLFTKTYSASLGWFAIYARPDMGPGFLRDQFLYYADTMDRSDHAERLRPHWHDIALDLSNSPLVYGTEEGAAPVDSGIPLDISMVKVKNVQISAMAPDFMEAELQPMSASYMDIQFAADVRSKMNHLRFSLGHEIAVDDPNLQISLAILTDTGVSYHEVELEKDDYGTAYFLVCVKSNSVCDSAGESRLYENMMSLFITISNSSAEKSLSILGLIDPVGAEKYTLQKVHFNDETLRVSTSGSSTVDVDLDNDNEQDRGIYTDAVNAWMTFDTDFYNWEAKEAPQTNPQVEVHPTRLTNYVNSQCRFRGRMGYDVEDSSSEELDDGWVRRTFKIKRKDGDEGSGNFYKTRHRFVCGKAQAGTELGVAGMPFYAAYAKMLAAINATDFSDDSFAMNLRSIFAQAISLGLISNSASDQEGEVEMEFLSDELLRMKYSDNLVLYYAKQ